MKDTAIEQVWLSACGLAEALKDGRIHPAHRVYVEHIVSYLHDVRMANGRTPDAISEDGEIVPVTCYGFDASAAIEIVSPPPPQRTAPVTTDASA